MDLTFTPDFKYYCDKFWQTKKAVFWSEVEPIKLGGHTKLYSYDSFVPTYRFFNGRKGRSHCLSKINPCEKAAKKSKEKRPSKEGATMQRGRNKEVNRNHWKINCSYMGTSNIPYHDT